MVHPSPFSVPHLLATLGRIGGNEDVHRDRPFVAHTFVNPFLLPVVPCWAEIGGPDSSTET